MATHLHILTKPEDPLASEIIKCQRRKKGEEVTVVNLTGKNPDYRDLLEKIFTADSVAVW